MMDCFPSTLQNVGQALQSSSGQRKILLFLDEKLELERAVEFHQTGTVKVSNNQFASQSTVACTVAF
jgi:hypothetical protein